MKQTLKHLNLKLIPIILLSVAAGKLSYLYLFASVFAIWWYPSWLPQNTSFMGFVTLALCSALALMITGIVPALYERLRGLKVSSSISYVLWALGLIALIGFTQYSQSL
jgi:hypothetical protein